jgi:hypothetical protein
MSCSKTKWDLSLRFLDMNRLSGIKESENMTFSISYKEMNILGYPLSV